MGVHVYRAITPHVYVYNSLTRALSLSCLLRRLSIEYRGRRRGIVAVSRLIEERRRQPGRVGLPPSAAHLLQHDTKLERLAAHEDLPLGLPREETGAGELGERIDLDHVARVVAARVVGIAQREVQHVVAERRERRHHALVHEAQERVLDLGEVLDDAREEAELVVLRDGRAAAVVHEGAELKLGVEGAPLAHDDVEVAAVLVHHVHQVVLNARTLDEQLHSLLARVSV